MNILRPSPRALPVIGLATLACTHVACGPSLEAARRDADTWNAASRARATAALRARPGLVPFNPPQREIYTTQKEYDAFLARNPGYAAVIKARPESAIAIGHPVASPSSPWLSGCLYDVGGEIAFAYDFCSRKPGKSEISYYHRGAQVVIGRLEAHVAQTRSYTNSHCLSPGLPSGGGIDTPEPAAPPAASASPVRVVMLGVSRASGVTAVLARYPVKEVDVTCTGTYKSLGYPP